MSWFSRGVLWIDMTANMLCGGSPDVPISARVGRHAMKETSRFWLVMEAIIDFAFYPFDGAHHCRQCYLRDRNEHYQDVGLISGMTMAFMVILGCSIVVAITRLHGFILILCLALLFAGCDWFSDDSDPHRVHAASFTNVSFPVVVSIVTGLQDETGYKAQAWPPKHSGDACVIKIDPKYYTHSCLGHEFRHCLDGYWHGSKEVDC